VPIEPGLNAGTAGIQQFFASIDTLSQWQHDVSLSGLFSTYFLMFGYPFDLAVEPLLPNNLAQPTMQLPLPQGEVWYFTGGPHGGWGSGSAYAALDFAAPGEPLGCVTSANWTVAAADGLVIRSETGIVVIDLDGDGYEQTGWTLLYLHVAAEGRVPAGTRVKAGDNIGHPSCEGGYSPLAAHLHIARRYNGMWIAADGALPFVLDGWTSSGTGNEYDGYLTRGNETKEAAEGTDNPISQINR
jgi:murein DD-endopeptidase MepM/ murein hydrolase activator NlpD